MYGMVTVSLCMCVCISKCVDGCLVLYTYNNIYDTASSVHSKVCVMCLYCDMHMCVFILFYVHCDSVCMHYILQYNMCVC